MNIYGPQAILSSGESGSGKDHVYDHMFPLNANGGPLIPKVKSMTARPSRGGADNDKYIFVSEEEFYATPKATELFVNEPFWIVQERTRGILAAAPTGHSITWAIDIEKNGKPAWLSNSHFDAITAMLNNSEGTAKLFKEFVVNLLSDNKKWLYGVPVSEVEKYKNDHFEYNVNEPKYAAQMVRYLEQNNYPHAIKLLHYQKPKNNLDIVATRIGMANDIAVREMNTATLQDYWDSGLSPDFQLMSSADKVFIPKDMVDYFNSIVHYEIYKSLGAAVGAQGFRLPAGLSLVNMSGREFYTKQR